MTVPTPSHSTEAQVRREYQLRYREANRARLSQQKREYYQNNREAANAAARARYAKDRTAWVARSRKNQLRREYGLTPETWAVLFNAQDCRCAICRTSESTQWATDHDHDTGKVRGILCRTCNTGIGLLQDNPLVIDKAAAYLRAHGK